MSGGRVSAPGFTFWQVDRQRPDGSWRQVSPGGMGSFDFNHRLFLDLKGTMKRGTIRLVSNQGEVRMKHTAGAP